MIDIRIEVKNGDDYIHYAGGFIGRVVHKPNGTFIIEPIFIGNVRADEPEGWFLLYNLIAEKYQIVKLLTPIVKNLGALKPTLDMVKFLSTVRETKNELVLTPKAYNLDGFNSGLIEELFHNMVDDLK